MLGSKWVIANTQCVTLTFTHSHLQGSSMIFQDPSRLHLQFGSECLQTFKKDKTITFTFRTNYQLDKVKAIYNLQLYMYI